MTFVPGKYNNYAKSTTNGAMTVTSASVALQSGDGAKFPPAGPFMVAIYGASNGFELVRVTSISGDTLSGLVRGQVLGGSGANGGLPAQAWASGSTVELVTEEGHGDFWNTGAQLTTPKWHGNTAQALAASGTIATAGLAVSVTNPGASCTGVILAAGTVDGQTVFVINTHATNGITFAAAGTSNVADGASDVIAALHGALFVWNAAAALWYRAYNN